MMVVMIGVLILCSFIISFFSITENHSCYGTKNILYKFTMPICLLLVFWMILSINIPFYKNNTIEEKLVIENRNNVQTVVYESPTITNEFRIINLNKKFDRIVDEDNEDVILTTYTGDWYAGIYWETTKELSLRKKNIK